MTGKGLIIAGAAMLAFGTAQAGPMKADKDGDARVSEAEYERWRAKRYAKWDTDGDGTITRAEWMENKGGNNPERAFDRADEDGDGQLSQAEVSARIAKEFLKRDADGDGYLSEAEA